MLRELLPKSNKKDLNKSENINNNLCREKNKNKRIYKLNYSIIDNVIEQKRGALNFRKNFKNY